MATDRLHFIPVAELADGVETALIESILRAEGVPETGPSPT